MREILSLKAELPNLRFTDYLRHLRYFEENPDRLRLKPLRIAVLRSYTVETIEPILKLRLYIDGYKPEFRFGNYNMYAQEVLDTSGELYAFRPDIVLFLVRVEELLPELNRSFGEKTFSDWEKIIENAVRQITSLLEVLERNLSSQIIVQNMSPMGRPYWGIHDAQQPEGETSLINRFNSLLARELKDRKSVFLWDFDGLLKSLGRETVYDPKMWYLAKNPFRQSAYINIADDLYRYIASVMGILKKCIVLDLDNTLWGGVAGEEGINGIALGFQYPGSCYRDFQEGLLRLYNRGILLAVNSKNNEGDALEIIDKHPYMVLRRKYFSAMRINWNDKVSNLKDLREELNIGFESMVFIDDNPAECEMVRRHIPECEVVCLPEKVYLLPDVLHALNGVENIRVTEEDRKKGEMYRSQAARKEFEKSFTNIDEYLASLEMCIDIEPACDFTVPRISQLTQKTNQMNLTTRRYTEGEIRSFMKDPDSFVFSVSSTDRFGDNGIVGLMILKKISDDCFIDSFLLSCRVIGRNIEQAMLAFACDFSRNTGARKLFGEYIPTAKNKPAADMYHRFHFQGADDGWFVAELASHKMESPPYILAKIGEPAGES